MAQIISLFVLVDYPLSFAKLNRQNPTDKEKRVMKPFLNAKQPTSRSVNPGSLPKQHILTQINQRAGHVAN